MYNVWRLHKGFTLKIADLKRQIFKKRDLIKSQDKLKTDYICGYFTEMPPVEFLFVNFKKYTEFRGLPIISCEKMTMHFTRSAKKQ